jgi:AraC family transcriptional regulator of adaptative response/methylated-DNA-[protein]-cysteine methyltransferase
VVAAACRRIEAAETAPSLAELAAAASLSQFHFHRVFKAATGVTPKAYASAHRAQKLRAALTTNGSVTQAIYDAGYPSSSRFYAEPALGMSPTAYKAGGAGAEIHYATAPCSLGLVLVAASGAGICAISLGDDAAALAADLAHKFPQARLADDPEFTQTLAQVVSLIDAPGTRQDLPLDIRGTAFQRRVWEALRKIPAGRTASYTEIAARIGAPNSVRAVAAACAANTLAVAVPCHRAVRADGKLAGYRWGISRKRALLEREAAK